MLISNGQLVGCSVAESDADDPSWKAAQETDAENEPVQTKNSVACHICGRVFKKSSHLTQHLRSHSGLSTLLFDRYCHGDFLLLRYWRCLCHIYHIMAVLLNEGR